MAQHFPGDYDGIPAGAPAIHWDRFPAGQIWYQLVQDRDNRMAPGVVHCGGGDGPQPQGLFEAPVNWVELAKAPPAPASQNQCRPREADPAPASVPALACWRGTGSADDTANFVCRALFG